METKPIQTALISAYDKAGLAPALQALAAAGVRLIASGGTAAHIRELGLAVEDAGSLTAFPSILGGRVKTLHPAIFGGILARRDDEAHLADLNTFRLPLFDLVVVDLYPFRQTLAETSEHNTLIEKIDIGGLSLIRAAAKNFEDVLVVPSRNHYGWLQEVLARQGPRTTLAQRQSLAVEAFRLSTAYDKAIADWLAGETEPPAEKPLRYGENPHQAAHFVGNLSELFTKLAGKELSYNNLLDLDGAFRLAADFDAHTFAIFKHANPCGVASRPTALSAWQAALASDPASAFGGILITGHKIDADAAHSINGHFYEILAAPEFTDAALAILKANGKRILLNTHTFALPGLTTRSCLNGELRQAVDGGATPFSEYKIVTNRQPSSDVLEDVRFAELCAKHLKSNAISIVKDKQLIGAGMGQTSRLDAMRQAFEKANRHGHDVRGAVLASDGFFPFADSVQMAHSQGIEVFLQPGGSLRDEESITYCNQHDLCMMFTGKRHFKH